MRQSRKMEGLKIISKPAIAGLLLFFLLNLSSTSSESRDGSRPSEQMPTPVGSVAKPMQKGYEETPVEKNVHHFFETLIRRCYSNWEPSDLRSTKNLVVRLLVEPDGSFIKARINQSSESIQSNFAAIEAVSECSKFDDHVPAGVRDIEITLTPKKSVVQFDCAGSYYKLHPEARQDLIICHLIPLDILNCNPRLEPSIVHSQENLLLLKPCYANAPELEALRKDWTTFLRNTRALTPRTIKIQANLIETKYAFMFEKRGPDTAGPRKSLPQ